MRVLGNMRPVVGDNESSKWKIGRWIWERRRGWVVSVIYDGFLCNDVLKVV